MRILWLSPWMRPTARVYAEGLQALGAEVMLVTSDLHPESDAPRKYETVLLGRPVPTSGWEPLFRAYRAASQFRPDVVITELLRDPRWRLFSRLAPRVRIVHDDKPHDSTHNPPWWNRMFFESWDERADAAIVFSNYVANGLHAVTGKTPVYVAPLVSDLDSNAVPDFVPAALRRNFLLMGRQRPYKNHQIVFAAWELHTRGSYWRGDELRLYGDGWVPIPLPPHASWNRGSFKYGQIVSSLAQSKGSILHYRSASQSGVQVLSMQLGVPTIVSDVGGLPEYQPSDSYIAHVDDAEGLAKLLDSLADPDEVEVQGKIALEHYRRHYEPSVAAGELFDIVSTVVRGSL